MTNNPTESQINALVVAIIVTSSASLAFTFFGLLQFAIIRRLHNFEGFIIGMLILGDFIQSLSILIPQLVYFDNPTPPSFSTSGGCIAQAYFQYLGLLLQFSWSFNIAFTAYNQAYTLLNNYQLKIFVIIIGIIIPITFSFIPLIADAYGASYPQGGSQFSDSLCFIQTGKYYVNGDLLIVFLFLLPLTIILMVNAFLFCKVAAYLRIVSGGRISNDIFCHLLSYPMILFITQIWFIQYLIYNMLSSHQLYNYQIWCYSISNLCGMFDVLAYGFNLRRMQLSTQTSLQSSQITITNSLDNKNIEL